MYILKDFSVLEHIIYLSKSKKLILYGNDGFTESFYKVLTALGVEIAYCVADDNSTWSYEVRNIYELLYEELEDICIIIPQQRKETEINKRKIADILGDDFLEKGIFTVHNAGGILEWDTIDLNLGYIQKKQFELFTSHINQDADTFKIVTLGGSTTYWNYMWENKSWSEQLAELYKKTGKNVEIYCGGMQGYTSTQEMLKCIRDVIALKPDLVISFSGANDVVREERFQCHPFAFEHLRVLFKGFEDKFGTDMPRIDYGLRNKIGNAEQWVMNIQIMKCVLDLYSIKFISFLQPMVNFYGGNLSGDERYYIQKDKRENVKEYIKNNQKFCDAVENLIQEDYIISLRDLLDGEDVFWDHVHVNERGNTLIAEAIFKHINIENVG